jgi:hypothetical protein
VPARAVADKLNNPPVHTGPLLVATVLQTILQFVEPTLPVVVLKDIVPAPPLKFVIKTTYHCPTMVLGIVIVSTAAVE